MNVHDRERIIVKSVLYLIAILFTAALIMLFAFANCSTIFGGGDSDVEIYTLLKPGERAVIGPVNIVTGSFPQITAYRYNAKSGWFEPATWTIYDIDTGEVAVDVPPDGKAWVLVIR